MVTLSAIESCIYSFCNPGNAATILITDLELRSDKKSAFYDGLQVLNDYPTTWLVKRFFRETLGVNYDAFAQYWGGPGSPRLVDVERMLIRVRRFWNARCNRGY
jgi:hypothetical protein